MAGSFEQLDFVLAKLRFLFQRHPLELSRLQLGKKFIKRICIFWKRRRVGCLIGLIDQFANQLGKLGRTSFQSSLQIGNLNQRIGTANHSRGAR